MVVSRVHLPLLSYNEKDEDKWSKRARGALQNVPQTKDPSLTFDIVIVIYTALGCYFLCDGSVRCLRGVFWTAVRLMVMTMID